MVEPSDRLAFCKERKLRWFDRKWKNGARLICGCCRWKPKISLYMIADKHEHNRTTKETVLKWYMIGWGRRPCSIVIRVDVALFCQATRERYLRDRTCRAWTAGSWLDVEKAAALAQAGHGLRSRADAAQDARARFAGQRCSRKPTHRNVPPLWNASNMNNSVARRSVWSISMKPTSTAIWTWATPGPKRTKYE